MLMNRRKFVGLTSAVCAGALFSANRARSLAALQSPHIKFPTDPRARLAISVWAFRSIIDAPLNDERDPKLTAMDMKDFAAHVRDTFNVVNIEPYNHYFKSLKPAYLDQFRSALEKGGSHAVNIAADLDTSYFDA